MKNRKFLAGLLTLSMIFSSTGLIYVNAEENDIAPPSQSQDNPGGPGGQNNPGNPGGQQYNCDYTLDEGGQLTVRGELPDSFGPKPWNDRNTEVNVITVEEGVTSIGARVFKNLPNAEKVSLPEGLKTIGEEAFIDDAKLKTVYAPDSLEKIDALAFFGTSVEKIRLGKSVNEIGNGALPDNIIILGYKDTFAEQYAKDNGLKFEALGEENNNDAEPTADEDVTTDIETTDTETTDTESTDTETTDTETTDEEYVIGDADGNGEINVTDIAVTAAHIKAVKALDEKSRKAADVDGNGKIEVTDIAMIAAHIKGIKALPKK